MARILYRRVAVGGRATRMSRNLPLIRRRRANYTRQIGRAFPRDSTVSGANSRRRILNISRYNLSPIPRAKHVVFKWASYMNISSAAAQSNSTYFLSTRSIYDPNYGITFANFTNTSCPWYAELMGTAPGQYQNLFVKYVDVCVKAYNKEVGTTPMVVCGVSNVGASDYPSTTFIQNLGTRTGHIGKIIPWVTDDSSSKGKVWRFRIYPWMALGITRKQYMDPDYITSYNTNAGTEPWLAISVGDSLADGAGAAAQEVGGQVFMDYHCRISNPVLQPSE